MIGTKNVADLLIKNGANINSITDDGDTALHLATLSGTLFFDTLQKIIGWKILISCLSLENEHVVEILIEEEANVDKVNSNKLTPLHVASMRKGNFRMNGFCCKV